MVSICGGYTRYGGSLSYRSGYRILLMTYVICASGAAEDNYAGSELSPTVPRISSSRVVTHRFHAMDGRSNQLGSLRRSHAKPLRGRQRPSQRSLLGSTSGCNPLSLQQLPAIVVAHGRRRASLPADRKSAARRICRPRPHSLARVEWLRLDASATRHRPELAFVRCGRLHLLAGPQVCSTPAQPAISGGETIVSRVLITVRQSRVVIDHIAERLDGTAHRDDMGTNMHELRGKLADVVGAQKL